MTLNDIITSITAEQEMPKAQVKQVVDGLFSRIGEAAVKGEEVSLPGFGKFKVTQRAARDGRNPATGEAISIAASRKLAFTAAKALKDKING